MVAVLQLWFSHFSNIQSLCHQDTEEDDDDDESSDSSESDESSSPAPTTQSPAVETEAPVAETTVEPTPDYVDPTIITDPDTGRGDSLGGYPSDYKSIIYVEDKSYQKIPVPYKSYEYIGKSTGYDIKYDNEVEKSLKTKAQVSLHALEGLLSRQQRATESKEMVETKEYRDQDQNKTLRETTKKLNKNNGQYLFWV